MNLKAYPTQLFAFFLVFFIHSYKILKSESKDDIADKSQEVITRLHQNFTSDNAL